MKAIELLKDYRNIDFGCNVEELYSEIDVDNEIYSLVLFSNLTICNFYKERVK